MKVLIRSNVLLQLCLFPLVVFGFGLPGLEEEIKHAEHEIPEDQIIELPVGRFPEPVCEYSVHYDDYNGRRVNGLVNLGDPLYHNWQCVYPHIRTDLYCMMVYNCTVSNNEGDIVPIIDEFGCTYYPFILPHISYRSDLEGGLRSNAFSLSFDQPSMFFNCGIKLLIKTRGICRRPRCVPIEWYTRRQNGFYRRRFK